MEKKQIKKQAEEKNNDLKDIKENFEEKTKDIKKELKETVEDLKTEIKDKRQELTEEYQEKSKEFKKEIKEKTEELKDKTEKVLKDIKDSSKKFDNKDIEENKAMAALAYIIAPIPYFVETKSKWVHYHAIQGMNLFIIFILLSLVVSILNSLLLWPFTFIKTILRTVLYTGITIFAIIGIVNVCNGEAKELPVINKIKIIKK